MNSRIENILHSNYDDEVFWLRLEEMPDVEAIQELRLRRDGVLDRVRFMQNDDRGRFVPQHGDEIYASQRLLTLLNDELRNRNIRLDSLSWKNAVTAIFGEEGYEKCRIWKAQNHGG